MKEVAKRNVKCLLTQDEKLEYSDKLARANREIIRLANHKAQVVQQIKTDEEVFKAEITLYSEHIANGYIYRDVECLIKYHAPENYTKTLTRKDTGETWQEPMTPDEINIFTESEKQKKKAEAEAKAAAPKFPDGRLSALAVCQQFGIAKSTLHDWVKAGKISFVAVENVKTYDPAEVAAFIEAKKAAKQEGK